MLNSRKFYFSKYCEKELREFISCYTVNPKQMAQTPISQSSRSLKVKLLSHFFLYKIQQIYSWSLELLISQNSPRAGSSYTFHCFLPFISRSLDCEWYMPIKHEINAATCSKTVNALGGHRGVHGCLHRWHYTTVVRVFV